MIDISEVAESLPKPRYEHSKVMAIREKLRSVVLSFTEPLIGEVFQQCVSAIASVLPSGIATPAIAGSLTRFAGSTLTRDDCDLIAKRLAGNLEQLRAARPVLSWFSPQQPEWVLAEILEIKVVNYRGSRCNKLTFDVITGSCAGYESQAFWSFNKLSVLAVKTQENDTHGFGLVSARFTKSGDLRSKYAFKDYRQLIGLHCYLLLDPARSKETPEFYTVGHTAGTSAYNRRLLKRRTRELSPCILDATISYDCYACSAGRNKCSLAVRPLTHKRKVCVSCKQVGLVDPNDTEYTDVCMSCTFKLRTR